MTVTIHQLLGDLAVVWGDANPVLEDREPGIETETLRWKIGDGVTAWNDLPYVQAGTPPPGGTTGQVLAKASGDDYDYSWVTLSMTDAQLAALAALTPAADKVVYWTGPETAALTDFTASARSFSALDVVQGDLIYASSAGAFARLAKSAAASRYLSNSGADNGPAWSQVDLANGVTGRLPFANVSQIATARVLGRTTAGTGDVEELPLTGTGNVVLSNNAIVTNITVGSTAPTRFSQGGSDVSYTQLVMQPASGNRALVQIFAPSGTANASVMEFYSSSTLSVATRHIFKNVAGVMQIGSDGGSLDINFIRNNVSVAGINGDGFWCNALEIKATPAAGAVTPTHTFSIRLNGTVYRVPCVI